MHFNLKETVNVVFNWRLFQLNEEIYRKSLYKLLFTFNEQHDQAFKLILVNWKW